MQVVESGRESFSFRAGCAVHYEMQRLAKYHELLLSNDARIYSTSDGSITTGTGSTMLVKTRDSQIPCGEELFVRKKQKGI